jgi:hypothetical protein
MADWTAITREADPWLDRLTTEALVEVRTFDVDGQSIRLTFGSLLQRVIYHYWAEIRIGSCPSIRVVESISQLADRSASC